jgi:hypothetical protein
MILYRKMSGLEPMQFGIRQIIKESLAAGGSKEDIGLPPKDQRPGFLFAKEFLPDRIQVVGSGMSLKPNPG